MCSGLCAVMQLLSLRVLMYSYFPKTEEPSSATKRYSALFPKAPPSGDTTCKSKYYYPIERNVSNSRNRARKQAKNGKPK